MLNDFGSFMGWLGVVAAAALLGPAWLVVTGLGLYFGPGQVPCGPSR